MPAYSLLTISAFLFLQGRAVTGISCLVLGLPVTLVLLVGSAHEKRRVEREKRTVIDPRPGLTGRALTALTAKLRHVRMFERG